MTDETKHSLPAGTVLNDKWVILEFIDKGGMGEIYRAHQLNLNRDVAIKILSKEWLEDIEDDEEELENAFRRFSQEVHTMAQIRHPNVIQIYDFDTATVQIDNADVEIEYMALEYIPGRTLRDTMREDGFYPDEEEVAAWLRKTFLPVLDGVQAIHAAGILHRDMKPANVLMDGDVPKIADFGLARSCKLKSMTCSLEVKGSPAYMAPEQFIDFKGTDQRTDIYSLGKILYEAVDGKIPEKAIPFRQAGLKEAETPFFKALDRIIRTATDEKPENRFQSVDEFRKAIEEAFSILDSRRASDSSKTDGSIHMSRKMLRILFAAGAIFAVLLAFWAYHSVREHFAEQKIETEPVSSGQIKVEPKYPAGVPREVTTPDHTVLKLVPGGEFIVPAHILGQNDIKTTVKSFYMDETPVTNQQFVDFLNKIRKKLSISDGDVKFGSRIYIYLGEVVSGYEPIIFENDFFRVKHSGHSACPVVRVTAYGAQAYARFYGRRLPTVTEWLYTAIRGSGQNMTAGLPPSLTKPVELPFPVMLLGANIFGIRGMNVNIGCWVNPDSVYTGNTPLILGGFEGNQNTDITAVPSPIKRNPWEAFEEVGFRCARDIGNP